MAIQPYECPNCGLRVERIEKMSEDSDPLVCPEGLREDEECGRPSDSGVHEFDEKIGRPNAHFKGSGFYVNEADDANNSASG